MTRPPGRPPHGRPGPGQPGLFQLPAAGPGAVTAAVEVALAAAFDDGHLEAADLALTALALKLAAAVDRADTAGDTRAVVSAGRELASLLNTLGLTSARQPPAREDRTADAAAAFLADLGTPTMGHAPHP